MVYVRFKQGQVRLKLQEQLLDHFLAGLSKMSLAESSDHKVLNLRVYRIWFMLRNFARELKMLVYLGQLKHTFFDHTGSQDTPHKFQLFFSGSAP